MMHEKLYIQKNETVMNAFSNFLFLARYRLARHVLFWIIHILVFSFVFSRGFSGTTSDLLLSSTLWVPPIILYCYPIMYIFIPGWLLKREYARFALIILLWLVIGWFLNFAFRYWVLFPFSEWMGWRTINRNPWAAASYLTMNSMLGLCSAIVLFKYWIRKEQDWMQAEQAKTKAELQLLKAQVHPHFLFNTLNNIYAHALENAPQTPGLILKLSSLLSYMLYDCREYMVRLDKEVEVMLDYIALEKERYGNRLEVSTNVEGITRDHRIAPLLMLPFLENAFKHGTSDQLEKPWLSMNISVRNNLLLCKIVNSRDLEPGPGNPGIGISNARKRLNLIYPANHQLTISPEEHFFAVTLEIQLDSNQSLPEEMVQLSKEK